MQNHQNHLIPDHIHHHHHHHRLPNLVQDPIPGQSHVHEVIAKNINRVRNLVQDHHHPHRLILRQPDILDRNVNPEHAHHHHLLLPDHDRKTINAKTAQ